MPRINELVAEVSREAGTAERRAVQLRDNAGAVADDVAALVRTVRTATTEADRRLAARVAVDVACSVSFGRGGASILGRLRDVSTNGATIHVDNANSASPGQLGNLVLTQSGGVAAQFEVRSMEAPGRLHVRFTAEVVDPAFAIAILRLIDTGRPLTARDPAAA